MPTTETNNGAISISPISPKTVFGLPRELTKKQLIGIFSKPMNLSHMEDIPYSEEAWKLFQKCVSVSDAPFMVISGQKYVGKSEIVKSIAKRMLANDHCIKLLRDRIVMQILPAVSSSHATPESDAFNAYMTQYRFEDCKNVVFYTDDQQVATEFLSLPGLQVPLIIEAHDGFNLNKINMTPDDKNMNAMELNPSGFLDDLSKHVYNIVADDEKDFKKKFGWVPSFSVVRAITKLTMLDNSALNYSLNDALFVVKMFCNDFASNHSLKSRPSRASVVKFARNVYGITREQYEGIPEIMPIGEKELDDALQTARQSSSKTPDATNGFAFKDKADLENKLKSRIIGQDDAIKDIIPPIMRSVAGLSDENKPIASFLFAGPSGVGKTEMAKALAGALFDDGEAFKRIDCGELNDKLSSSRLLGASQGYLGSDQGGELSNFIFHHPHSVILFDEIEKASPDVYDSVLLQLLDAGHITGSVMVGEGKEREGITKTLDATGCVIIMTSNLGSSDVADRGISVHGFGNTEQDVNTRLRQDVMSAITQQFRTEQINRFDKIVIFHPLDEASLARIFTIKWRPYGDKLAKRNIAVDIDSDVATWFATQSRKDKFGARNLLRTMNSNLIDPLADGIIDKRVKKSVHVSIDNNHIVIA